MTLFHAAFARPWLLLLTASLCLDAKSVFADDNTDAAQCLASAAVELHALFKEQRTSLQALHPDELAALIAKPKFSKPSLEDWIRTASELEKDGSFDGVIKLTLARFRLAQLGDDATARGALWKSLENRAVQGYGGPAVALSYLPAGQLRTELEACPRLLEDDYLSQLLGMVADVATVESLKQRKVDTRFPALAIRRDMIVARVESRRKISPDEMAQFREKELRFWRAGVVTPIPVLLDSLPRLTADFLVRTPPFGQDFLRTRWQWASLPPGEAEVAMWVAAREAYPEAAADLAQLAAERRSRVPLITLARMDSQDAIRQAEKLLTPIDAKWNIEVLEVLSWKGDAKTVDFLSRISQDPAFQKNRLLIKEVAEAIAKRITEKVKN